MNADEMKTRTRTFALRVIKLVDSLPTGRVSDVLGKQLLRSATSIGANYRAARRARSRAEFISKLGIVEEEADESSYWLELLADSGRVKASRLTELRDECEELLAIVVATIRSAKKNRV
ncbi:MAG TPA: four helix bundle protein [Phycisphaerales bacterium]